MAVPVAMPRLGMTMQEGTLLEWAVPVGGEIEKGGVLLRIESEKAEVEIEATASGVLRHVYVEAGQTVPCGTLLGALTETTGEPFDPDGFRADQEGALRPSPVQEDSGSPAARIAERGIGETRTPITPAARAVARRMGLDPAVVPGTGPSGRVTREDVERFAASLADRPRVAEGVRLEVLSEGEGEPVLLLPGFGTDLSAFALQVPVLAERFRALGVHPRGVGLSDAPETDRYDVSDLVADAAALVDEPAHVIGASLGAAVALELALAHPERIRSLTLITPFLSVEPRLLAVIDGWCALRAAAPVDVLAQTLLPWLFSESLLSDTPRRERVVRGLARAALRVPAATMERTAAGLRAWRGLDRDRLRGIGIPTLVVVAGADLLTPGGDRVADAVPAAKLVRVEAAGHAVALEAPDPVNRAILDHLGR